MKNGKDIFLAAAVGLVAYGIYQWQQSASSTTPATTTTGSPSTAGTSTPSTASTGETQTSVSETTPAVWNPLGVGEAID